MLSETWLNSAVSDAEISLSRSHDIYRRDRPTRGGGVLLAVNSKLKSRRRFDLETNCEVIWIEVASASSKLLLACYYRPPDSNCLELLYDSLLRARSEGIVVVAGDFNLNIKWESATTGVCETPVDRDFLVTCIHALGLGQHVLQPTRCGAFLDLLLSSVDPYKVSCGSNYFESDDDSVEAHFGLPWLRRLPAAPTRPTPCWARADWKGLRGALNLLPASLLDAASVDEAAENLSDILLAAVNDFVPMTRPRSCKFAAWVKPDTRLAVKNKRSAWALWKQHPNPNTKNTFQFLRKHSKGLLQRDYNNHIQEAADQMSSNPKRFWSLVNSRKRLPGIPNSVNHENKSASDTDRPSLFNEYFCSNFQTPFSSSSLPLVDSICSHSLSNIETTPDEVKNIISSLKSSRATGPDGLSPILLKNISTIIASPLSSLFNRCFSLGRFPQVWKRANVIPVPKSANKSLVSSYRPISLLSILSFVLEKIIHSRLLYAALPYISSEQHGFLPKSSCLTNLLTFQNHILSAFSEKSQLDAIFLDFSKAFDTVDHTLLLHKLSTRFNLHGSFLSLISDFLHGREQRVVISGSASEWKPVVSGVPQGSVLGPLLFSLFMDDLAQSIPSSLSTNVLLYADDCKIFKQISSVNDSENLQTALSFVHDWCTTWRLQVNPHKSAFISFTLKKKPVSSSYSINSVNIQRVSTHKDLGVFLDEKLSFASHIEHVRKKSMSLLGLLFRFTDINDQRALRTFFTSLILPISDFCSPVWTMASPSTLNNLDRILSFFISIVRHRVPDFRALTRYEILNRLGLKSLRERRVQTDITFFHKILNNNLRSTNLLSCLSFRVPSRNTRLNTLFHLSKPRLSLIQRSYFYRTPALINSLPSDIDITLPLHSFLHLALPHLP